MKIKKVAVKNFKCFKDAELDFSSLNLFTGKNSSGKSSMLNAILAIVQSYSEFPFSLSSNGKYVIMGDYYEFVRKHRLENPINIDIVLEDKDNEITINTMWENDESTNMPSLKHLEAVSKFIQLSILKDDKYNIKLHFNEELFNKSEGFKAFQLVVPFIHQLEEDADKVQTKAITKEKTDYKNLNNTTTFSIGNIRQMDSVLTEQKQFTLSFALALMTSTLRQYESNFNYISSFRMKPERTYTQRSQGSLVSPNGDYTIDQIFQWNVKKSPKYKELVKELKHLGLLNNLTIKKFRGGRYEVRITTRSPGSWASIVDVGFGISQFLPIIVSDLQLTKGSTLMIDQPEIHLHPSAQVLLTDYLLRQIKEKNKIYFIETHSEYLLNRVRAAIVKGTIDPNLVKVYYFENQGDNTEIYRIKFTKDGKIVDAPQGFFDTYLMDIMDIAISAVH